MLRFSLFLKVGDLMACPENCKQFSISLGQASTPLPPHSWGVYSKRMLVYCLSVGDGLFFPLSLPPVDTFGVCPPYTLSPFATVSSLRLSRSKRSDWLRGEIRARGKTLPVPCYARSQKHGFCLTRRLVYLFLLNTIFLYQGFHEGFAPLTKKYLFNVL